MSHDAPRRWWLWWSMSHITHQNRTQTSNNHHRRRRSGSRQQFNSNSKNFLNAKHFPLPMPASGKPIEFEVFQEWLLACLLKSICSQIAQLFLRGSWQWFTAWPLALFSCLKKESGENARRKMNESKNNWKFCVDFASENVFVCF